jgi:hypothetical protein
MRATALIILLCISSDVVSAQTTEQCRPTQRAGDLLACYNRTAPPHTLGKPKTSKASTAPNKPAISEAPIAVDKPAVSKNPTDRRERYVDVLAAENSKLDEDENHLPGMLKAPTLNPPGHREAEEDDF